MSAPSSKPEKGTPPVYQKDAKIRYTETPMPDWKFGDAGNDDGESLKKNHREIDPHEQGRPTGANYKLLISAIIPRPIGFVSTVSKDGSTTNVAPFSYFQVINHDPPLFVLGFASSSEKPKDSLRNLSDTGECVLNIVSAHFLEAMNACSIDAPPEVSEFELTGLHPAPCKVVKAPRVQEAVFSIECQLLENREYESRVTPGKKTGVMSVVEGVRFWAREDAIDEKATQVDISVLDPIGRLGAIDYSRVLDISQRPRPKWAEYVKEEQGNASSL